MRGLGAGRIVTQTSLLHALTGEKAEGRQSRRASAGLAALRCFVIGAGFCIRSWCCSACAFFTRFSGSASSSRPAVRHEPRQPGRREQEVSPEFPALQKGVSRRRTTWWWWWRARTQEKNRQFVERLGAKLEAETNLFHDVFYQGDLTMMGTKALLFVPESDLDDLQQDAGGLSPVPAGVHADDESGFALRA